MIPNKNNCFIIKTIQNSYFSTFQNSELPSATPTFSSNLTIESAVCKFYINSAGLKALQSVL